MGFKIAVDDTGSGYARLNTVSEIIPDVIKMHRSVVQNIDKNSVKESMVKGLLLVAREAGSVRRYRGNRKRGGGFRAFKD
ncbi:EAL domain-containing protein [Bacillus sp. REN3]|uniref:EAL domain-containing protein n=1 Tax=Bacillus sp. REN3 TaxID=2802440 RepID=UPI001FEF9F0C|nr:EAL domain-containing protein [Bacillus sp. REN3]